MYSQLHWMRVLSPCYPHQITGVNFDSLLLAFTSNKSPNQFYLFIFLKSVNAFLLIFTLNTLPQVSIISHQDYCSSLLAGLPLVFSPRLFSHWCRALLYFRELCSSLNHQSNSLFSELGKKHRTPYIEQFESLLCLQGTELDLSHVR